MCLLREAKRSSIGGGGCDGAGEGFVFSLGFGAMAQIASRFSRLPNGSEKI